MDHGNKKLQIIIFAVSYTCDAMNHTLSGKLNITFIYLFFLYLYKICNVKTDADTRVSYLATELFVFTAVFSLLSCLQLAGKKKRYRLTLFEDGHHTNLPRMFIYTFTAQMNELLR